jgi:hypothetical protein
MLVMPAVVVGLGMFQLVAMAGGLPAKLDTTYIAIRCTLLRRVGDGRVVPAMSRCGVILAQ